MASVTGLTAARMIEIEKASVIGGFVDSSGNLVLINKNGDQINAGVVEGPQGVPGPPGENGTVTYTWLKYADTPVSGMSDDPTGKSYIGLAYNKLTNTESNIYSDYKWSLIRGAQGDQGVPGPPGADGKPRYTWIKYAVSQTGDGMSDDPTGKLYIGIAYNKVSQAESTDPADYIWALIKGDKGLQGDPGVQGPPGADGSSLYTWVKYATSATGANISDSPTGRDYIGLAYNKTSPVESTTPSDYTWSLIQGPAGTQGVPGPPGANGTPRYTWLKYADSPTTGMSDDPTGKDYIGLAYNKTTATESSNYSDYKWTLVKGAKGDTGVQGPPGADGAPRYTWIKYGTSATGAGLSDNPSGKTYIGLAYNKTTDTESSNAADYTWSLIQGPAGTQGVPGPPGANGTPRYTWLKYADSPTTGMSDDPTGKTYLGLAYNKLTATESTNYTDYTWSIIKGDKGDKGDTGATGATGPQGLGVASASIWFKQTAASASAPAKPTTLNPDATWTAGEPEYVEGTRLWTVFRVVYSNNTFLYSNVSESSSYKAATTAMDTANGKNRVTYSSGNPSGTGTTAGDLWFKISGSLIVGMWIWNGSAWQSRTLDNATIANLDAGKIVTGLLDANRIGANTITVGKLMVGDFTNLIPNAQWLNDFAGWIRPTGLTMAVENGIRKARIGNSAGVRQVLSPEDYVSVQPGETYYLEVTLERVNTFTAGTAGVLMYSLNPTSLTEVEWQKLIEVSTTSTTFNGKKAIQFRIPDDGSVLRVRPGFFISEDAAGTGTAVKFRNAIWRRMASGELIVDGDITSNKLNAAEIWAAQAWIDILKTRVITTEMVSNDFGAQISLDDNGSITILTAAANQAQGTADAAATVADRAETKAASANDQVTQLGQFYRFTSTEAVIGKYGNPTELRLKNDEIGIYQSNAKVSWWNAGQFFVNSAVLKEARVANLQIVPYGTDRTLFRKV